MRALRFADVTALYDERSGRLHLLNESARLLWRGLVRGESPSLLARRAARRGAVSVQRVREDFAATLAAFREQGLVGAAPVPARSRSAPAWSFATRSPECAERRGYRIAGVEFSVTASAQGWRHVGSLLEHLRVRDGSAGPALEICAVGRAFALNAAGFERIRTASVARLQGALVRAVAEIACQAPRWGALLHAGAVARDGRCLVLPAPGGSGKTTLVAALAQAGYAMLGDDVVALDTTLQLVALPLPLRIKRGSWARVGGWYPQLYASPVMREGPKRIRLLAPSVADRAAWERPHEVSALVRPSYRAGAPARLVPCAPREMLETLFAGNSQMAPAASAARVRRLLRWLRARPAYRLEYGDVDAAREKLDGLIAA